MPLSAPSSPDVQNGIPSPPLSVPRFSQPLDRNDVRNDLQVCSTLQALLGLGLQRLCPGRSGIVSNPLVPSSLSAFQGFLPSNACGSQPTDRRALRFRRPCIPWPLCHLVTAGFPHRLGPTLELCSRPGLPLPQKGFTPPTRARLSWPFLPQGFTPRWPWT